MLPLELPLDKQVQPRNFDPMDVVLRSLGSWLENHLRVRLEWSLRAGPGSVARNDRCIIWVDGSSAADFDVVAKILRAHHVASSVLERQSELANHSVAQGICLARRRGGIEWSLYLHHRDPDTRVDRYEAWSTIGPREGNEPVNPEFATYEFSFLPETPAGVTPTEIVHTRFQSLVQTLCERPRFAQMSGFWLRHRQGAIDRIDLTVPWHPPLAELDEPLRAACAAIDAPTDWLDEYAEHGVRHIGLTASNAGDAPCIAVYFSAPHMGSWPRTLDELRERVRARGETLRKKLAQHSFEPSCISTTRSALLDDFYSAADLEPWREVLGPGLHYHHGIYERISDAVVPNAIELEFAAERAVRELYPLIPGGARVYDLGCGWGSPALMLVEEHGCRVLGATISRAQYRHCAMRGLPVRYADMEETLPPGRFDCAMLLESFSHVRDKLRLLRHLRRFCNRLVMRVNCQDAAPASANFGGTMHMISSTVLRDMLEQSGWSILHWRDRRPEVMPTVSACRDRISLISKTNDHHFETFRSWTRHVLRGGQGWVMNNPLIEVAAVPADCEHSRGG